MYINDELQINWGAAIYMMTNGHKKYYQNRINLFEDHFRYTGSCWNESKVWISPRRPVITGAHTAHNFEFCCIMTEPKTCSAIKSGARRGQLRIDTDTFLFLTTRLNLTPQRLRGLWVELWLCSLFVNVTHCRPCPPSQRTDPQAGIKFGRRIVFNHLWTVTGRCWCRSWVKK